MFRMQFIKLSVSSARYFSGSVCCHTKQEIQRRWQRMTDRYLQKTASMISGTGKNKNKLRKEPFSHAIEFKNSEGSVQNAGCQRRARQLSVVFYDYITSLLSSGEVCAELNNFGFEVVKVKVVSDMSTINVSWAATGGPVDELISALLPRCASELRSKLMDLRVMGNLPPIHFIKDVTASRLREVEELLKKADMGPDFEPSDIGESLKVQPSLINERLDYTDRRYQAQLNRLEGFSCKPGPGGNVEVLSSNEKLDCVYSMRVVDYELLAEKTSSAKYPEDDTTSTSVLPKGACCPQTGSNSEIRATDFVSSSEVKVISASDVDLGSQGISDKYRSNIYGLDHSTLYQQVLQTKRRAEDRSYLKQPDSTPDKLDDESSLLPNCVSKSKAQRRVNSLTLAYKNKTKAEPIRRDINRLLSSQFHENDKF